MLRPFQDYVRGAVVTALAEMAPWMKVAQKGKNRVLASGHLPERRFPYRFVEVFTIRDREEFLVDLGWSDTPSVPQESYYDLAEPFDGVFRLPDCGCTIPLRSEEVSGKSLQFVDPCFEALSPSTDRQRQSLIDSSSGMDSRRKLTDFLEVCGFVDPTEADIQRCVKRPGVIFGTGMAGSLSTNWQIINYLGALRDEDAELALARPVKSAISQLGRRGLPFLRKIG